MKLNLKYFLSKWIPATIAVSVFIGLISCSDSTENKTRSGKIQVYLTDAPADFKAVNIYVKKVKIHYAETDSTDSDSCDSESSWYELNTVSGYYNLLELQDSNTIQLVNDAIPAGKITQIRLMLADSNHVITDTDTFNLKVPSGLQSGYKIIFCDSIPAGEAISIVLDFDAGKSIIQKGNGEYQLKPVLKAYKVN